MWTAALRSVARAARAAAAPRAGAAPPARSLLRVRPPTALHAPVGTPIALRRFAGTAAPAAAAEGDEEVRTDVLTKEEQARLTPAEVLRRLKEGNGTYVSGDVTSRDHVEQVRKAAKGQYPKAVVLSCLDSRVPVEDVFDCGIGDLFVARVAGNFANTDIIASMEFACKVAGAKLVLCLGHEHCGAVKGAIDKVQLGLLPKMLENIEPAVEDALARSPGTKRTSADESFVHLVAERNVALAVDKIRRESEVLRALEAEGSIMIVGAMYDMDTAEVVFME
ncbi:carbonic anhydrase [Hyaloraphidium curvatum]|nr:carbonic anhydrase [Hyaloraphidium curvatum]